MSCSEQHKLWEGFHHLFCNSLLTWWTSKTTIQLVERWKKFYSKLKGSTVIKVLWINFFPWWCSFIQKHHLHSISSAGLQLSHINCTGSYDHTSSNSSRKSVCDGSVQEEIQEEMLAVFWNMVDLSTFCRISYLIIFPSGLQNWKLPVFQGMQLVFSMHTHTHAPSFCV